MDKSPRADQIIPGCLWKAKEGVVGPLADIFVFSSAIVEMPKDGMVANIVLLFKKRLQS